jgi:hypothetical protein
MSSKEKGQTRLMGVLIASCLAGGLASTRAQADENLWGYTYGSETLPKGAWEFYQWATWRQGKGEGTYDALDLRTELEYGITDRFQASAYLNTVYQHINNTGPVDPDTGQREFPNTNAFAFQGVSLEFKYALTSPYKDPIGVALYFEPSYSRVNKESGQSGTEYELEPKIIVQKNFLEDQLIAAANLTAEFEWERFPDNAPMERELKLELTSGLSYRFAPNWFAGPEARLQGVYGNMNLGDRVAWALFAGPAIHYAAQKWWATLSIMPQIMGGPRDPALSSHLNFDEFERTEVRLKVGINF